MNFGLIHTASLLALYASSFGFPYTGKTRFRWVASPYRVGFEPLDSLGEFQVRCYRLSQRPRLRLAPLHYHAATTPWRGAFAEQTTLPRAIRHHEPFALNTSTLIDRAAASGSR